MYGMSRENWYHILFLWQPLDATGQRKEGPKVDSNAHHQETFFGLRSTKQGTGTQPTTRTSEP